MTREQHLSDEAIAAFADGMLRGGAQGRAARHCAECPECAYAISVQREAVWALRAAPAPSLPTALLDRLRDVPATTPIVSVPTVFGADGRPMFASFGRAAAFTPPMAEPKRSAAAFSPPTAEPKRPRRWPFTSHGE